MQVTNLYDWLKWLEIYLNRDTLPFHNNTTIERKKYGNKVRHFIDYTRNIACVEKQSVSNILVRW